MLQNSYFFDYLGVLCVCNDRPIPENQGKHFICHCPAYLYASIFGSVDNIIEKLVKQHGQVCTVCVLTGTLNSC